MAPGADWQWGAPRVGVGVILLLLPAWCPGAFVLSDQQCMSTQCFSLGTDRYFPLRLMANFVSPGVRLERFKHPTLCSAV